jgi:hypothetical protein
MITSDNGTYIVNLSSSAPDVNYIVSGSCLDTGVNAAITSVVLMAIPTLNSFRFQAASSATGGLVASRIQVEVKW